MLKQFFNQEVKTLCSNSSIQFKMAVIISQIVITAMNAYFTAEVNVNLRFRLCQIYLGEFIEFSVNFNILLSSIWFIFISVVSVVMLMEVANDSNKFIS